MGGADEVTGIEVIAFITNWSQYPKKKQKSILNWKNIWKLVSISIEQKSKLWQQRSGSWTDLYFHYQVHFHVHVQLIARPNMKTNDQNICIRWSTFPFRPVLTNFNPVAWLSSIKMILIMTKKKFNVGKKTKIEVVFWKLNNICGLTCMNSFNQQSSELFGVGRGHLGFYR